MKIGILGYGRMGHTVERVAIKRGHRIVSIFDVENPLRASSNLQGTEVFISFTKKDAVIPNLVTAAKLRVPVVEGTTGWYNQLGQIKSISNLTMIYSPNFSEGVYQFSKLVKYAAELFSQIDGYDCYLHEWHHRGKADSPSGTAKNLANILIQTFQDKEDFQALSIGEKIRPKSLSVSSTRAGSIPGTHEVGFDSEFDLIQVRHQAYGRESFAIGAVRAAEWIFGKKGIFTMDDFMGSLKF